MCKAMKVIDEPLLQTANLGGVPVPSADVLKDMHRSQYILHARGGRLTQVAVEKTLLPHCPKITPQGVEADLGCDGTIYVRQVTLLCKSADGGRTWTGRPIGSPGGYSVDETGKWAILRNGLFVCVAMKMGPGQRSPAHVFRSRDEGRSWEVVTEIPLEMKLPQSGKPYAERYCSRSLERLKDDTLLWAIDVRDHLLEEGYGLFFFRSTDGGRTWDGPRLMWDWGSEGGTILLPSGRVLATLRYQRPTLPGDPPDLEKKTASIAPGWPYKHVFIMHSDDGGKTWSTPRQLVSVFGQTFGYPAVQSDGTVIVTHDTRYGPGPSGCRAVISRDEGKTWEDEVYYLDHTVFTGSYAGSVVLDDDTVVTIAGSSQTGATWENVIDRTDLYATRWKPVKA